MIQHPRHPLRGPRRSAPGHDPDRSVRCARALSRACSFAGRARPRSAAGVPRQARLRGGHGPPRHPEPVLEPAARALRAAALDQGRGELVDLGLGLAVHSQRDRVAESMPQPAPKPPVAPAARRGSRCATTLGAVDNVAHTRAVVMAERSWGHVRSGATFEALATTIVFFEDPGAALFGRRGKDGGQDARSRDGLMVYQAKYHGSRAERHDDLKQADMPEPALRRGARLLYRVGDRHDRVVHLHG